MKKSSTFYVISIGLILVILGLCLYRFDFAKDYLHLLNNNTFIKYDGTYIINGERITLINGISEVASTPGSASKTITRYFGNDVTHDLDGDGTDDTVFIVTQETGGSGIFYYLVARLNTITGPVGSDGVLLGDRIAPQTTEIDENSSRVNVIVVNYADRNPGEPMSVKPSLGKSIWLKLDPKTIQFGVVEQNFSGEADTARMTLDMKTWNWVNTIYSDDKIVKPATDGKFTITFKKDGTFSARTDCNGMGGEYSVNGHEISFDKMISTQMYCENSQEKDFSKMLEQTQGYLFTSKGEMVLVLKYDSGSVFFR